MLYILRVFFRVITYRLVRSFPLWLLLLLLLLLGWWVLDMESANWPSLSVTIQGALDTTRRLVAE